ncbi:biotin/lipoyl-containing protein [Proteiniborus sp. MB09-C3]|uniref:biotin/lipoyl-containing protein n=1 Tax=Proteiniborus sp. MB09-C3 TaxID=3050072 RepID=UPI002552903B|nr:biotin/lipoyl-containing protein [Proteiniborus sp. MB09-C3]WIV13548.1 biotin/lipoyl-containing protein [Proteiniborus sp. MB09-C3]
MKKFIVNVNGKSYEVEVEEIGGQAQQTISSPAPAAQPAQPKAAPAPAAPKAEAKPAQAVPQGAEIVEAPMPGTILDIKVKQGDTVKKGQVLLILEAMKMENEIMSPRDGKVTAINTTKGSSVNVGDPLVSLE